MPLYKIDSECKLLHTKALVKPFAAIKELFISIIRLIADPKLITDNKSLILLINNDDIKHLLDYLRDL